VIKITPEEFKVMSTYIYGLTGIYLDATKGYLVESRFDSLLRETGCSNYSELYFKAKSDPTKVLPRKIIDAITTNETLFFRDTSPFELLQHKILPDLIDKRSKGASKFAGTSLRIWSAASSTGQEIYSIAIVLRELLGPDFLKYNIRLLGTDISDQAVATASKGIYGKIEIGRGLPQDKLQKYFTTVPEGWKIKDELRAMATFRNMNLMDDFSSLGKFDIVLCRNVAIYFNEADKIKLFSKIQKVLEPDGYLLIGSTESISGIAPQFESKRYLRAVFYQLKGAS